MIRCNSIERADEVVRFVCGIISPMLIFRIRYKKPPCVSYPVVMNEIQTPCVIAGIESSNMTKSKASQPQTTIQRNART